MLDRLVVQPLRFGDVDRDFRLLALMFFPRIAGLDVPPEGFLGFWEIEDEDHGIRFFQPMVQVLARHSYGQLLSTLDPGR